MSNKLTAREVMARLKGKSGKFADGGGLYLVVPKSGDAYWMLRYTSSGKRREMTLDKVAALSLADARLMAGLKKREAKDGVDPLATRKREQQKDINTVNDLFADWHTDLKRRLKYPQIPERIYNRDIKPLIGELPLETVNARDVRAVIQRITTSNRPTIANDALMYCKQLFNHGIKLDLMTNNPASAFNVVDAGGIEESRKRKLSIEEVAQAFKAFRENSPQFSRDNYLACALLVVLGVRKSELIAAPWAEFDLKKGVWHLPANRSKTGAPITIPLPAQTIDWLNELELRGAGSAYVFPNRVASKTPYMGSDTLNRAISKMFGHADKGRKKPPNKMGDMEYFTPHDLRRTCRSLLSAAGVSGHIAERCVNHALKKSERVYDRHDYFNERKEALGKIADMVAPVINNLSNVTPFKAKTA